MKVLCDQCVGNIKSCEPQFLFDSEIPRGHDGKVLCISREEIGDLEIF